MARRGRFFTGPTPQQLGVATEDFRIFIDKNLRDFMNDDTAESYPFPADMNNVMRKYVHAKSQKMGLKSKSHGKEPNRILTVYKKKRLASVETFNVGLSEKASQTLSSVCLKGPSPSNDSCKRQKIQQISEAFGHMFLGQLYNVEKPQPNKLMDFRKTLPIYEQKDTILEAIKNNSVVIVSAETGSGKTTQIPQYILEQACEAQKGVRVICTQPRRLSTISVADRVASERGEHLGQTVGYQIKLESKLGQRTSLIYCTNGVLLRTFMSGNECFKNITHILVDEIHERDKFTDFLLICLRECIKKYPHLRVVLMSATMDMEIFTAYFRDVKVINVKGRCFSINSVFLDEILLATNYENDRMKQMRALREKSGSIVKKDQIILKPMNVGNTVIDKDVADELNEVLLKCFYTGQEEDFVHLLQLILNESVSPNYQEPVRKLTPLMVAAAQGNLGVVEQLLNLGADPFHSCKEGITASGWAQQSEHEDIVRILSMYPVRSPMMEEAAAPIDNCQTSQILSDYDRTVRDEMIDFDLVVAVIQYIHESFDKSGAILVFLAGYDDIVNCSERIRASKMNPSQYKIYMLHSSMQMGAQHEVFARMPHGKQKIVLSTNIAETSITIDDICFVVDSGRVKMKSYDAISGISTLRPQWISMASAMQRAGRAGRTQNGYCFHLYSLNRYNSFCISTMPEILRVPLHELCLHTKTLAPNDMKIEDFLKLAIEPPSTVAVTNAINVLKNLGALDADENLTPLGNHLVRLSIEPHLGKMLIYGAILRCLDPVLTIVACLTHKDPFLLPANPHMKTMAMAKRRFLSEDSLSDHFAILRAFQLWQNAKVNNQLHKFCDENFISGSTMEMIVMTRSQLVSQLRAMGFVLMSPRESMHELNEHAHVWALVKACLSTGLYPNVAYYNEKKLHTRTENQVAINQISSLKQSEYSFNTMHSLASKSWFIYEELSKIHQKCNIKCASAVTPLTIALICGLNADTMDGSIILDDWFELNFYNDKVPQFRAHVERVINTKINVPRHRLDAADLSTLWVLAKMLNEEDEAYGLKCPDGVGQRPRITGSRSYNLDRRMEKPNPSYSGSSSQWSSGSDDNSSARRNHNHDFQHWRSFHDPTSGTVSPYNHYPALFPEGALYFIIKPYEIKNIIFGKRQNMWRFSVSTEKKLIYFHLQGYIILLIFTVNGTQSFHGVARLVSSNSGSQNQAYPIDWLTTNELPFHTVKNFIHPKIHVLQDGQQLQSAVGQRLCSIIYKCISRGQQGSNMRPILGKHSSY